MRRWCASAKHAEFGSAVIVGVDGSADSVCLAVVRVSAPTTAAFAVYERLARPEFSQVAVMTAAGRRAIHGTSRVYGPVMLIGMILQCFEVPT